MKSWVRAISDLAVSRWTPWLVFAVAMASTLVAWYVTGNQILANARDRFGFRLRKAESAIRQRMLTYEQVLRGGAALFAATGEVSRQQWATYVKQLGIERHYPGIQGIGFSQRILPAEKEAHIRAIRAEGFPDYTITPPGDRAEYTSIVFLEPFDWRNRRAFGYDMFSHDVRREAMARARDSGTAAICGKITLRQETDQDVQPGFLMFVPLYRQDMPRETIAQRRDALIGYVYSPFRATDLMRGILGIGQPDVRLEIFDGNSGSEGSRIYDSLVADGSGEADRTSPWFTSCRTMRLNGHPWTVHYSSLPAFERSVDRAKSLILLVFGSLVSVLLLAVVRSLVVVHRRAIAAAREMAEARRDAEAANRAKSEFLANMSHEIRTPMTAILGFSDVLQESVTAPDTLDAVNTIKRNGRYLLEIINSILDLSKIEAGKTEITLGPCSPWRVAVEVLSLMRVRAKAKGLSLDLQHDGPIPESVRSDPTRLRQILINLVGNALKFTEVGGVRLVARLAHADADDAALQFDVVDTGIGIAEDQFQRLFQPFTQIDNSSTRRFGGTGLGLALSKRLAELLGGSITVRSILGKGSTFTLTVSAGPLAGVRLLDDPSGATLQMQTETAAGVDAAAFHCRVLLAEDGPDNQRLIAFILRNAGAEVTVADNGQIAVDLALAAALDGDSFDVILMDMQMPVLDGYLATKTLRAHGYAGTIVALTAHAMKDDRQECLRAGCDDYATKPIDRGQLLAMISRHVALGRHTATVPDTAAVPLE